jgi:thiol-disulfide isomerase/thioredoxin
MPIYLPDSAGLKPILKNDSPLLVVCFCAAWCDTCTLYQPKFTELSASHPDSVFVWADIESFPELLGDEDVENFPTLLIQTRSAVLFFGTMLPHIQQLDRLLQTFKERAQTEPLQTGLPDVWGLLCST